MHAAAGWTHVGSDIFPNPALNGLGTTNTCFSQGRLSSASCTRVCGSPRRLQTSLQHLCLFLLQSFIELLRANAWVKYKIVPRQGGSLPVLRVAMACSLLQLLI